MESNKDIFSIHTFIDGIFITKLPLTTKEMVKIYLMKLNEGS
jgi:hypothetical protein